jgi:hypothetical protein
LSDVRKPSVTDRSLKRKTPVKGKDLQTIANRLGLRNHTEALEEAITVLLLITERNRRAFLLEDGDGSIIKIRL